MESEEKPGKGRGGKGEAGETQKRGKCVVVSTKSAHRPVRGGETSPPSSGVTDKARGGLTSPKVKRKSAGLGSHWLARLVVLADPEIRGHPDHRLAGISRLFRLAIGAPHISGLMPRSISDLDGPADRP